MSGDGVRNLVIGVLLALVLGGIGWFFSSHLEPSWESVPSTSEAAAKNPMLGAERLLARHGYRVKSEQTLSLALFQPLPNGTLILTEGGDSMLATQSKTLLDWVERGNTLIVSPGWRRPQFNFGAAKPNAANPAPKPSADKAAEEASDSIGAHFGVSIASNMARNSKCRGDATTAFGYVPDPKKPASLVDCVASVTLPGAAHPLRLDISETKLVTGKVEDCDCKNKTQPQQSADADDEDDDADGKSGPPPDSDDAGPQSSTQADATEPASPEPGKPEPLIADDEAKALRVYAHGKGRVVLVAEQYFDNYQLAAYDHGELLLGLAALNAQGKNVTLIERVDIASWFKILWHAAPYAICTLAAFLLLWAWSSMRRFGPQLPDPDDRRRALLEHVNASGRWLWKSNHGREIMLAAMRRATERTLARRIPELRKLAPERQVERLAADGKMSRAELERALLDAPGRLPIEFTRQIQTLQELRAHYER